jgi:membrane protease YdiL (CAAX protease family)
MNRKKIILYILFTFTFSWSVALGMHLAHISIKSIQGIAVLALLYMPGPALATFIIQKFIYKEGFRQYGWTIDRKAIKWIFFTPLIFLALTLLTFTIIGVLGNSHLVPQFGQLDFTREHLNFQLRELAKGWVDTDKIKIPDIPPVLLFVVMLAQGIIAGSTINLPFMFGEELGWRGLMFTETLKMGFLRSSLFIGLVWGIWHLPVILMGHNYPHHPYLGSLMMCLFTMAVAPLFSYVRAKTRSILGSCMLHGMINATGSMYLIYVADGNELYSFVAGWAGIIAAVLIVIVIYFLDRKFVGDYRRLKIVMTV